LMFEPVRKLWVYSSRSSSFMYLVSHNEWAIR